MGTRHESDAAAAAAVATFTPRSAVGGIAADAVRMSVAVCDVSSPRNGFTVILQHGRVAPTACVGSNEWRLFQVVFIFARTHFIKTLFYPLYP